METCVDEKIRGQVLQYVGNSAELFGWASPFTEQRRAFAIRSFCLVKVDDRTIGKGKALRLLQTDIGRVNVALATPVRERRSATFEASAKIWERDYLALSKLSTRSGARNTLQQMKAAFRPKDMRSR